jgi:hypothetical protein
MIQDLVKPMQEKRNKQVDDLSKELKVILHF